MIAGRVVLGHRCIRPHPSVAQRVMEDKDHI